MNPYIGITDFTNFGQVGWMLRFFKVSLPVGTKRMLHVGVMMSYKTLLGISSRWVHVFPPKESIASIFSSPGAYNCLHYADYDNSPRLGECLAEAISYGGSHIKAIQLDMTWPDPDEIVRGVDTSGLEVILQIGKLAMDEEGNSPQKVVERLGRYSGVVQRVLLDRSVGRGIGMDAKFLAPFALAIRERFPGIGIGVAGGLGPETVQLVAPLVATIPDLSIDAQSRLRPSGSALDPVDWGMAGKYLVEAIRLFVP